jgi:antagonist of KipI
VTRLRVDRPGMLTTIQDLGRWGAQHHGVPPGGAMDVWSARLANRLVGNDDEAAVLESTLIGPTLTALDTMVVAVTGARFAVSVGGLLSRTPVVASLAPGATIVFGARLSGARAYIAVPGGVSVPPLLGSRSTHLRAGLGGIDGRALRAGDILECPGASGPSPRGVGAVHPVSWLDTKALRVFPGPRDDDATRTAFEVLCSTKFQISPQSDRMGYRLSNRRAWPPLQPLSVSQPVVTGAVQLPPGGEPILLMADRQTTGGYPIIGVVVEADVAVAAQRAPGDVVTFVPVSAQAAAAARVSRRQEVARLARGDDA